MIPNPVLPVDEIQLADPAFWLRPRDEREGAFATLRAERPVAWMKEVDNRLFPPGPGFWSLTKHEDIQTASRNPDIFCSGKGAVTIPDMPQPFLEYFGSLINMDDPKHKRLRGLVSSGFTARQLARAEDQVRNAAVRVVERIRDKGRGDFVADISAPFPIQVICDMVGIPESQHDFVLRMTNTILGGGDPEYIPKEKNMAAEILGAGAALVDLMKDLRKHRLAKPTDDLTSILTHAEIDGSRLTDQELGSFFVLLATAGNETTRTALSQAILALCRNPDQRAIWQADYEGVAPTAVEEIVRWATPVIMMRRTATRDTVLRGQPIKAGDKLILWYCSGNRDEDIFVDPFKFDVRRKPNDHVGFGGPGPHYCLGANLAKREIHIMLREVFRLMPGLELAGEPDYLLSLFINGIKRLPVTWKTN